MSDHRQYFLEAIEKAPMDEVARNIYADWLDEQGEVEEANRQRKFVPALGVLEKYANPDWEETQPGYREKYIEKYGQDEWDEVWGKSGGPDPFPYEQLMREVEWWKEGVLGKSPYGSGTPWIGFGSNFAQDELRDEEKKQEFWEAFEVVTGIKAPVALKQQEWYKCAC